MIQNQSQYRNTKNQLAEFERSSIELDNNPDKLSPRLLTAQKAGLQVLIDRLKVQMAEYERLQEGVSSLEIGSLDDLPIAIIKARISLGMTQKELAEKIGTQEQQIQRYEADRYAAISFDRMMKIVAALGMSLKNGMEIAIDSPKERLLRRQTLLRRQRLRQRERQRQPDPVPPIVG